jgi:hypothetical protein
MSKLHLGAAFAIAITSAIAACGGKVVVDTGNANAGGSGGGGAGGATGGFGGGIAGGLCFPEQPDPASLFFCGGSVGAGGNSSQQCENDWCDDQGNTYSAVCDATTCQCTLNGKTMCTCALNGAGNFCVGTPTCCPLPGAIK